MGQKVNPTGLRIGVIKDWESRWYADKSNFGDTLVSDKVKNDLYLTWCNAHKSYFCVCFHCSIHSFRLIYRYLMFLNLHDLYKFL